MKLRNAAIFPQERVVLEYEYGTEDGSGNTTVTARATLALTWAEFTNIITSTELQNLGSINSKMKDEIKSRVALLASALDM